MALTFIDGCDHVSDVNLAHKWDGLVGTFDAQLSSGRTGQGGYRMDGNQDYLAKVITPASSGTVGFKLNINEWHTGDVTLVGMYDSTTTLQFNLEIDRGLYLFITRGGTVIGRATRPCAQSAWNGIEWFWEVSNSISASGHQVKLNGELVVDVPATTDARAGSEFVQVFIVGNRTNTVVDFEFDDFYVTDTSGAVSGFLGDFDVLTVWPTCEGTAGTNFNPFDGASGALDVDNRNHDYDTTYIHASEVDDVQTFVIEGISATEDAGILGVALNASVRKADAGKRMIAFVVVASGTSADSVSFTIPIGFVNKQAIWTSNPSDGGTVSWAASEINAASYGLVMTV